MNPVVIKLIDALYPSSLRKLLKEDAPEEISAIGDIDILKNKSLAIFVSSIGSGQKSGTEANPECNSIL